jgi:hypothetical protein
MTAVAAVAAAMLAYATAGVAAPLRLEIEPAQHGVLLHITYPAAISSAPPHHLTAIDSRADRWGLCGDAEWRLLWAIVPPAGRDSQGKVQLTASRRCDADDRPRPDRVGGLVPAAHTSRSR